MVLLIGCVIVVTLVVEKMESRFNLRWDLTDSQIYSIGDTTKEVLKKLDKDITIYTLYETGSEDRTISEILRKYEQKSTYIKVVNVDPLESPFFTQQFETDDTKIEESSLVIQADGTKDFRVISAQDLYEWQLEEDQLYATGMIAEQRITSAIFSIEGGKRAAAYFVTGHGEMNVSKQYYLAKTLESDGYKVSSYDLVYNDTALTSDDCLLFLSPMKDLTDEEYEILQKFMDGGGKAVYLINPLADELSNFNRLFDSYGLKLENNLIVETDSTNYLNSQIMIKPQMNKKNPVLQSVIEADAGLVLPRCRGIASIEKENIKFDPIIYSSESSYGKVNPYTETLEKETGDTEGPFLLGATAGNNENGSKLVLLGSSDFVSTLENAKYEGNIGLFMDSVAWASGKVNSVAIQPKSLISAPLKIPSTAAGYRLMILVIIVMPVIILISGALVWRRRLSQ
jgi:ABC-type uncharacterized transport system involved in gliding motility auxiliary subunit